MKLQKQLSRRIGNKEYSKWVITISSKNIKELGWKEGLELEAMTNRNSLIIKPKQINK